MIVLRFLHDTPFDMFEGTFRLALEIYKLVRLTYDKSTDPGHIIIEIWGTDDEPEDVERELAKYSHWFDAEAIA